MKYTTKRSHLVHDFVFQQKCNNLLKYFINKSFEINVSTERNHCQNFLVKSKNNLKSYKIKNNGESVIEFYTSVQKLVLLRIVIAIGLTDNGQQIVIYGVWKLQGKCS